MSNDVLAHVVLNASCEDETDSVGFAILSIPEVLVHKIGHLVKSIQKGEPVRGIDTVTFDGTYCVFKDGLTACNERIEPDYQKVSVDHSGDVHFQAFSADGDALFHTADIPFDTISYIVDHAIVTDYGSRVPYYCYHPIRATADVLQDKAAAHLIGIDKVIATY